MNLQNPDEPTLIREKKRVRFKKTTGKDIICNIPLSLWNFIFSKLELVDLIILQRTSCIFIGYKVLDSLIKQKTKAAFSRINKKHWNQLTATKNSSIYTEEYCRKHAGKFLLSCLQRGYGFTMNYSCGAFSTKERMISVLKSFNVVIGHDNDLYNYRIKQTAYGVFLWKLEEFAPNFKCVGIDIDDLIFLKLKK